ncbi:hypothetical protein DL89DRAFT_24288 [Linderina pennispora]|uniref:Uncharacterized protein n=1 Tax=Linderina pennispora TaxID=61395 RepID=A0A1Y1WMX3_9FUNG|nr:uncharacterized protein DL89DRAFT_24288 [Linderina pennispora]ORX74917.1 hypothetical protein DL89DRAFT_24288 [Linderina pennispora]
MGPDHIPKGARATGGHHQHRRGAWGTNATGSVETTSATASGTAAAGGISGRMQSYDGGFHDSQARHYGRGARSQDPYARSSRYQVPAYMRRSTEPSDSLEEGELDIDDRISRRTSNPNAIPVAPRQFRAGRETVSPSQRRTGLGFRNERRSPRPLASQESAFSSQPAFIDRRRSSGSGSAPRSTQASRQNTPSPRRHTPLVESPETEEIRITDSQAPSGDEGERTANAPAASTSELPRRHLETRLSDIDREIAECQEKLVMISSTSSKAPAAAPASQQRGSNDRAVPASPPIKASGPGARAAESGVEIIDGSSRGEGGGSGAQADAGGEKDESEHAASVVPQVVSDKTKAAFSGGHASDGSGR